MSENRPRGLGKRAQLMTWVGRAILRFFAATVVNVQVHNRQAATRHQGPLLIVSNHISMSDPVFLWGALRRRAIAVSMAELWNVPFVRRVMNILGQIPVRRRFKGDKYAWGSGTRSIELMKLVLQHGGIGIIYPNGRCTDGGLEAEAWYDGAFQIAHETGTPLLPSVIVGSNGFLPKRKKIPRLRRRVDLFFGEVIYPSEYDTSEQLKKMAAQQMQAMLAQGRD